MIAGEENEADLERRWQEAVKLFHEGDVAGSLFMFKSLAKDGEAAAYREVANIYEQPDDGGVKQDFKKAREWYTKAIEISDDVYGYIGLGRIFYYGKDCPRNFSLAFEYYSIVEENNIPVVNLMLGRMYGLGNGVEKDDAVAKEYYWKAINDGNLIALKDLGLLELESGDYIRGLMHWLIAAVKITCWTFRDSKSKRLRSQ